MPLERQTELLQYHRQGDDANTGHAGGADRGHGGHEHDGQLPAEADLNAVDLGDEDCRHALIQGGAIHVHRGAKRQHERSDLFRHPELGTVRSIVTGSVALLEEVENATSCAGRMAAKKRPTETFPSLLTAVP